MRILQRQRPRPPRLTRDGKVTLAVLAAALARLAAGPRHQFDRSLLLFKPDTILKWHRELARRKSIYRRMKRGSRPTIPADVEGFILRLARENPRWGHRRIQGELGKLGHVVSTSAVRAALWRHRVPPVPLRRRATTWRRFISRHNDQLLACNFFTVETVFLQTLYALFVLDLGTRRVYLVGCTAHPTAVWVTQQARNLAWSFQDADASPRILIHDRDTKFPSAFDAVFAAEGVAVVRTPYQAPTANAYAERWVGSVRAECLDHLLVVNEARLDHILSGYVAHYNRARPHRGLDQQRQPFPPQRRDPASQVAGRARRADPRVRPRGGVALGPAGDEVFAPDSLERDADSHAKARRGKY